MDWDGLSAFVVFAEHLNFTKAARSLHLSQPALHAKVQRFSSFVGMPLYAREGRQLVLTQAGEEVARFGRVQLERNALFLQELRGGKRTEPVVLIAGEGAYLYLLGEGIRAFQAREEGSSQAPLQLLTGDYQSALHAVVSGRAHLGVGVVERAPEGVEAALLCEVAQGLVCPASHPLAAKSRIGWEELEGVSLILPPEGRPHREAVAKALGEVGVGWHLAVEARGWELMLHFAALGLGLTIVNACCQLPAGLVFRPIPALPTLRYQVFHLPHVVERPEVVALKETLLDSQVSKDDFLVSLS